MIWANRSSAKPRRLPFMFDPVAVPAAPPGSTCRPPAAKKRGHGVGGENPALPGLTYAGAIIVGWVEHGNPGSMVRCANRSATVTSVLKGLTPCVTHHFPSGSLHAPYVSTSRSPMFLLQGCLALRVMKYKYFGRPRRRSLPSFRIIDCDIVRRVSRPRMAVCVT